MIEFYKKFYVFRVKTAVVCEHIAALNLAVAKTMLLVVLSTSISVAAFAQNEKKHQVKGKVTDENNEPLIGVGVKIKHTGNGTSTSVKGEYALYVLPSDTLVFTYIGYKTEQRLAGGSASMSLSLTPNASGLNEVVVVGYGTQKKANLTGAVSTVKMDEVLGNRPVSTVGTLLQGAVPGLQVNIGNGAPGASKSFNIRGATTLVPSNAANSPINSDGPLILVDNVPFDGGLNLLDPNDIETVTVLKDAGSAAIYGARSAFGVILVTTKKGTKNQKVVFNYSNNLTLATPINLPEKATVLQAIQSYKDMGTTGYWTGHDVDTWLDLAKQYDANPQNFPNGYAIVNGLQYPLAPTDGFKNLLGKSSRQYLHNFSASGGSEKITYRISLGTTSENGIIVPESKQDYYKRYNVKSVVTSDVTNWLNVQLDAAYYNATTSTPGDPSFSATAVLPPYSPLTDSLVSTSGIKAINGSPRNSVLLSYPTTDRNDDTRLTGRAVLKPFTGFTLTGEYTYDNLRGLTTKYNKITTSIDPRTFNLATTGSGAFRKTHDIRDYKALNIFGNYVKSFKDHHLSFLAGFNQEERNYEQEWIEKTLPISPDYPSISTATGILDGNDNYSEYSIRGYFGRVNYDYKGKYLLEVNGRNDLSSKFPVNHRSGFFPSASVGWVISKERFMDHATNWLSELKIRGSYGNVGNQVIDPYQFVPTLNPGYATWLDNYKQVITLGQPRLVSSDFTWATVQTVDAGLDFGFFNSRLTGNFDVYQRDTKNLLSIGQQLPAVLGADAPYQNVASLQAKGFELSFNWKDKIGKVSYRIGANLADFKSKITKVKNESGVLKQYYVGQQPGEIYGYTTDRLYTVDDFVAGTLSSNLTGGTLKPGIPKVEGEMPNPGDVLYKDLDGNGIINQGAATLSDPGDRRIIGNSSPRYQYGVNGGVSYKGFDFSFVLVGVGKAEQFRSNVFSFPNFYAFGTIYNYQLDYWTPSNMNSFYPRTYDQAKGNQPFNQYVQTKYLLNAAYLKVRNLTLGYSLPASLTNRLHLRRLQFFGSVENAFTFDHLPKGSDPDITLDGRYGYDYPFMRQYSIGVNMSF